MSIKLETTWNLRAVMASRGIYQTTKLIPLLAEHDIELSREQIYRLVTGEPRRVRLDVLATLCHGLNCDLNDLIVINEKEATARKTVNASEPTKAPIGDLRPLRAVIRRPGSSNGSQTQQRPN